eukprot:TRINITY_DN29902_c0_g1_i1.p3 TRINITY_DN29902_c0_g1~~TRINITY_DN29902_c0_g1_i1.p3  ORF type:complete len:100 (+),score=19.07 TRINITY_DN29902_c0_g1_i1:461-760(+)
MHLQQILPQRDSHTEIEALKKATSSRGIAPEIDANIRTGKTQNNKSGIATPQESYSGNPDKILEKKVGVSTSIKSNIPTTNDKNEKAAANGPKTPPMPK